MTKGIRGSRLVVRNSVVTRLVFVASIPRDCMAVHGHNDARGEEAPAIEPGSREPSGETGLAAAVLRLALEDLQRNRYAADTCGRRAFRQAYVWVASNERRWPFSFLNVCDMLELSPRVLRAKLLVES